MNRFEILSDLIAFSKPVDELKKISQILTGIMKARHWSLWLQKFRMY